MKKKTGVHVETFNFDRRCIERKYPIYSLNMSCMRAAKAWALKNRKSDTKPAENGELQERGGGSLHSSAVSDTVLPELVVRLSVQPLIRRLRVSVSATLSNCAFVT